MEIWKVIPGYENYTVSNLGNIKRKEKQLKQTVDRHYLCVNLYKDGKPKKFNIHQLVYLAFNSIKSNSRHTIDHINSNKHDNCLDNLRVVEQRFNASKDRRSNTGLTGVYEVNGKYRSAIRIDGKLKHLGTYKTPVEAENAYKNELNKL